MNPTLAPVRSVIEAYDPAATVWIDHTSPPSGLTRLSATAAGGGIHLMGGGSFGLGAVNQNPAIE